MDTPTTLDDLTTWLGRLAPAARIAVCRLLADRVTVGALAAIADATVHEATRTTKAAEVAEQLGLTERQVQRAVASHNERTRERTPIEAEAARIRKATIEKWKDGKK